MAKRAMDASNHSTYLKKKIQRGRTGNSSLYPHQKTSRIAVYARCTSTIGYSLFGFKWQNHPSVGPPQLSDFKYDEDEKRLAPLRIVS